MHELDVEMQDEIAVKKPRGLQFIHVKLFISKIIKSCLKIVQKQNCDKRKNFLE